MSKLLHTLLLSTTLALGTLGTTAAQGAEFINVLTGGTSGVYEVPSVFRLPKGEFHATSFEVPSVFRLPKGGFHATSFS